jgi:hypothetical protein
LDLGEVGTDELILHLTIFEEQEVRQSPWESRAVFVYTIAPKPPRWKAENAAGAIRVSTLGSDDAETDVRNHRLHGFHGLN